MDGTLQYQIQIENAQALAAIERFNAASEKMAAKIDGIRTTAASAGGASTSFFDKVAHFGTNIANTVAGVEALGKAIGWLKGAQTAAAVSAQVAATANSALATASAAAGAGARAGAVGLGLFGGAAAGAAVGIAALMAAAAALLPIIAAVSLAVSSLGAIGKGIGLANEFERTSIAFKTLTGDAKQAQAVMSMLSQMAIDTPFDEATLQGGARALLAARVPASALKGELKSIGNIAAATNGDIGRLATVYAQVAGKGKLYAEELQQFVEQGAGELRQAVSETLGVTTGDLMDMMQKGQVGFSVLQQSIQSLANDTGKWGGAMSDQSTTNLGLLSSLGDNIGKILRLIATPITDGPLKSFLSQAVTISSQVSTVLSQGMKDGNMGEVIMNALIWGAKMGVNGLISIVATIPQKIMGYLEMLATLVGAALSGSVSALAELKRQLGSFSTSTFKFDTSEQDNFFKNMLTRAQQVQDKAGEVSKTWAEDLDSVEAPKGGDALPALPRSPEEARKMAAASQDLPSLPKNQIQARMALATPPEAAKDTPGTSAAAADAAPAEEAPPAETSSAYLDNLFAPETPAPTATAPAIPAAPQGGGYRDNSMTNAAQVAGKAAAKIQGYSRVKQGGADAARGRAEQRMTQARLRIQEAYNPSAPAAAVQAAVSPPGAGRGGAAGTTESGGASGGLAPVVSKLEGVITELQRIRTE